MSPALVRTARASDAAVLLDLVDALADYEKLARPDAAARERLIHDAFGPAPRVSVLIAEAGGGAVGYALYFETYSSFLARSMLYLEDLFVIPARRGEGHGLRLLRAVAGEATARGCARLEWAVLRWNTTAIAFYDRIGGRPMDEWHHYRLEGDPLMALGSPAE